MSKRNVLEPPASLEEHQGARPGKIQTGGTPRSGRESKPTPCSTPPIACGSGSCSAKGKNWSRSSRTCRQHWPLLVLKNEDWTRLNPNLSMLDQNRQERLLSEVNELLFLWIAEIDESLESRRRSRTEFSKYSVDRDARSPRPC